MNHAFKLAHPTSLHSAYVTQDRVSWHRFRVRSTSVMTLPSSGTRSAKYNTLKVTCARTDRSTDGHTRVSMGLPGHTLVSSLAVLSLVIIPSLTQAGLCGNGATCEPNTGTDRMGVSADTKSTNASLVIKSPNSNIRIPGIFTDGEHFAYRHQQGAA